MTRTTHSPFAILAAIVWLYSGAALTSAEPASALRQLQDAFESVAQEASKSVVVITVTSKPVRDEEASPDLDGNPFGRWFGPERRRRALRPEPQIAEGSGFVIRADGYILTNQHVVDEADKIEVKLQDGRSFLGKIQGSDEATDMAVIKIDAKDLPVAKLADSDKVRVGQWAIAIGAPFHLDYSITVGVVSAKGRVVPGMARTTPRDFLQTDASINPGNSGGPLVDIDGNVVGVNTAIRGLNTGIGFAIPINLAKTVADKLITSGKVTRSWMGIAVSTLSDDNEALDIIQQPKEGALVKEIGADTPADKAGLQPMDVVTAINGKVVKTSAELQQLIQSHHPGEIVRLEIWRKGEKREIKVTLQEMPGKLETTHATSNAPVEKLGLRIEEFSKEDAGKFGVPGLVGVRVAEVDPAGRAASIGISPGDVITEIDRQPIRSVADFQAAASKTDVKRGVEVHFTKADGHARTVGILRKTND